VSSFYPPRVRFQLASSVDSDLFSFFLEKSRQYVRNRTNPVVSYVVSSHFYIRNCLKYVRNWALLGVSYVYSTAPPSGNGLKYVRNGALLGVSYVSSTAPPSGNGLKYVRNEALLGVSYVSSTVPVQWACNPKYRLAESGSIFRSNSRIKIPFRGCLKMNRMF